MSVQYDVAFPAILTTKLVLSGFNINLFDAIHRESPSIHVNVRFNEFILLVWFTVFVELDTHPHSMRFFYYFYLFYQTYDIHTKVYNIKTNHILIITSIMALRGGQMLNIK